MPHAIVSRHQKARAKTLRQTMTPAETLLWRHIKAGRLEGLSFRRQVPLGRYILDFVCHAARIVIELDGVSHQCVSQQETDHRRDAWLVSQGYVVMRFANGDVLKNLAGVAEQVREMAATRMRKPPALRRNHPPPYPSPTRGEGTTETTSQRGGRNIMDAPVWPDTEFRVLKP